MTLILIFPLELYIIGFPNRKHLPNARYFEPSPQVKALIACYFAISI